MTTIAEKSILAHETRLAQVSKDTKDRAEREHEKLNKALNDFDFDGLKMDIEKGLMHGLDAAITRSIGTPPDYPGFANGIDRNLREWADAEGIDVKTCYIGPDKIAVNVRIKS